MEGPRAVKLQGWKFLGWLEAEFHSNEAPRCNFCKAAGATAVSKFQLGESPAGEDLHVQVEPPLDRTGRPAICDDDSDSLPPVA